ncbi:MAG: hypothetical protein FWC62_09565, partial [Firmicutes bacterium]|nr:hypothetical protein [Bacillota bacterium]
MDLDRYFADLESRIDGAAEDVLLRAWLDFADLKLTEGFFSVERPPKAPGCAWEHLPVNDALQSDEGMIYQQLYGISETLRTGGGEILSLRSNFGTGIIPSMFGAEIFMMPRETDTLPGPRPLPGGKEALAEIIASGRMDFTAGFAGRVFSVAEKYLEYAEKYPKVKKYVSCYNPDLQGPLSLCEAVLGSDFYLDFYLEPESVERALDFFTAVYIAFTEKWQALCPTFDKAHSVEWGCLHRGGTIVRNDAAMNVSGELYGEFVRPRDQRIISRFGGGVHFCGRGQHYVGHLANIEGLSCINMSQPDWNDMEIIYQNTIDR